MIALENIWDSIKDKKIVVYDLETTGFKSPQTKILSFSAIRYNVTENGLMEIDRRNDLINPEEIIPARITEINHITNAQVRDCPTENQIGQSIIDYLNSADIVAGYNSHSFDNYIINEMSKRVLRNTWFPKEELDVYLIAKKMLIKGHTEKSVENYKLGTLARYFHADKGLEFHNSIDDVIATSRVLWGLINICKNDEYPKAACAERPMLDSNIWTTEPVHKRQSSGVKNIQLKSSLWHKSKFLNRLYINNTLGHSVYYDIYKNKWVFDYAEDEDMIENILSKCDLDDLLSEEYMDLTLL